MTSTTTKTLGLPFKTRLFHAAILTLGLLAYNTLSSWPIKPVETDAGQTFFHQAPRLYRAYAKNNFQTNSY